MGVPIPKKNDLEERLARYPQIKITLVGVNSGKTISNPVWFVLTCAIRTDSGSAILLA
jgi:hypothetical protein